MLIEETTEFSSEIIKNYSLQSKHLFMKKAGNAKYYYQLINDNRLQNDLKQISKLYYGDVPFKIFGMHTNLYITEKGYNGFFIDFSPKNPCIKFDKEKQEFILSSNVLTSKLVNYTMNLGYDFASLTGIPGMVGSGVVGNASWANGNDFGKYVKEIRVFDFKECKEINIFPDKNFFEIRNSFIKTQNINKTRYFVKELILTSDYIGIEKVKEKYLRQINQRRNSLKTGFKEGCAGSVWGNIDLRNKIGKSFRMVLDENPELNININGARYSEYT